MRRAPHAVYNGVNLHELADQRRLFWVGGPPGAYDSARHVLQYTAEELRRWPLDRGVHHLRGMLPHGAAFLFRPLPDDFRGRDQWREFHVMAAHRKWTVFDAEEFLATMDGRDRPYIGIDLASGPDVSITSYFKGDRAISAAEFLAEFTGRPFGRFMDSNPPAAPAKRGVDKYITPEIEARLKRLSGGDKQ